MGVIKTIGKGIVKIDDYIKFGKLVDELSSYAYTILYVPKKDEIVITVKKDKIQEIQERHKDKIIETKTKGGLTFIKLKW